MEANVELRTKLLENTIKISPNNIIINSFCSAMKEDYEMKEFWNDLELKEQTDKLFKRKDEYIIKLVRCNILQTIPFYRQHFRDVTIELLDQNMDQTWCNKTFKKVVNNNNEITGNWKKYKLQNSYLHYILKPGIDYCFIKFVENS